MIKVSVVIPVYGVEKYIEKCIESVVNQTLKEIEILVINDGTKDNSIKIIHKKFKDGRIKIINKENGGISSARNKGIELAKGKYIYFLDSDDWIEKETLELLYNNSENEDITYSDFYFYDDLTKKRKKSNFRFPFSINNVTNGKYYLCNGEEINVWNKLYKVEFLEKYNFKFIENIIYEDQDFGFKTMILAEKVKYISNHLYNYRINRSGSIMNSLKKEKELIAIKKIIEELKKFFSNIKLDDFQKARLELKLLSLELWEKEKMNKELSFETTAVENKIKKIFLNNKKEVLNKRILKLDIEEILKKKNMKKINILDIFYWKNGLINFKIIKNRWK